MRAAMTSGVRNVSRIDYTRTTSAERQHRGSLHEHNSLEIL